MCARLIRKEYSVPILMLTARTEEIDIDCGPRNGS